MSHTYKLSISYNGRNYRGFQYQKGLTTVQHVLNEGLQKILSETVNINPSGRTDTGVHALKQVCNFSIHSAKAIQRIKDPAFVYRLNCVLPDDITVLDCVKKSGFDAQKNAQSKIYEYLILISPVPNPFLEGFVWRLPKTLRLTEMKKAARFLLGRHDFSSFCATDSTAKTRVREILDITFSQKSPAPFFTLPGESFLRLEFHGRGFLKQMVRNIVGTLVEVGEGKRQAGDLKKILHSRDRRLAGRTAPAQGLYLVRVHYAKGLSQGVPKTRALPH